MYKLIVVDVDGTVYRHSRGIHPLTKAAIAKAKELNIPVVIATGRNISTIGNIAKELGIMNTGLPFVAQNGGQVFRFEADGQITIEYTKIFKDEESRWIFEIAKKYKAKVFAYSENEKVAYKNVRFSAFNIFMWIRSRRKMLRYKKSEGFVSPITKFIVFGRNEHMIKMRAEAETKGYSVFAFSYVNDAKQNIEINPIGVNKAEGLKKVIEELGITADEVIYFGDGENDLDAIKWAGHGVAMGNANQHIKSCANAITSQCTDGGVGQYLFDNVFNLKESNNDKS
ncbi:Cof-type HAD-IIB family hydrolase [Mesoplasma syrphidae]|uniref:Cof-type HAD-IIB family hydrolase n=1 Tax=Mesoplasma syrphidae TaxID=225999 RepID=A0A2K9CDR7_9MOLU|nr:HAD family hydrolase [Mesoplasma syrphidae]AUF83794.1 Cof-type HAD-IIB family hydrolase [Mesoplasma syrphidae]